ncbi:MAG TPA: hypothetical protein VF121_01990 [Thermoanaerobaculia bacterium]|nr:hypothetical protein [Thermoanaerobaculia bacterium]
MPRVQLVHWNAAEAAERAERLRAAGWPAEHAGLDGRAVLRRLRDDPPAAVVVDLGRQPSHGRELAVALRLSKATRHLPLVFAGGDPEKVGRIRELLPDAVYASWDEIDGALARAVEAPPYEPVVPPSHMEGYSGRPLVKKLGIKPGTVVGLIDAPRDFAATVGPLPEGAALRPGARGRCDLLVWFVRSRRELLAGIERIAARPDLRALWIAWPKKASAFASDLGERDVRGTGLATGLVDYKICAIDATWSGLLFARRRP